MDNLESIYVKMICYCNHCSTIRSNIHLMLGHKLDLCYRYIDCTELHTCLIMEYKHRLTKIYQDRSLMYTTAVDVDLIIQPL